MIEITIVDRNQMLLYKYYYWLSYNWSEVQVIVIAMRQLSNWMSEPLWWVWWRIRPEHSVIAEVCSKSEYIIIHIYVSVS